MKEIETIGFNIKATYEEMKRYEIKSGEHCFCMFNGKKLLSTYTLDECYKEVTGVTLAEYEEMQKKMHEEHLKKEEEFRTSIPSKIDEYRKKAIGIIPDNKIEYWNKIVPIRLNDLYHGMELDCWLELVAELNKDIPKEDKFQRCKEMFDKQGHSGMSASLVFSGLEQFHELGKELVKYIQKDFKK